MISKRRKMSVLKSIAEDYCKFKVEEIGNKIVIDGRIVGGNKYYFIYEDIDEALLDLEDICMPDIEKIKKDNSDFIKNELDVIKCIKHNLEKTEFSYFSKLKLLEKYFKYVTNMDFEFDEGEIIVKDGLKVCRFENIDDVLMLYYDYLAYEELGYNRKMVLDVILENAIEIIKGELKFEKHILLRCSPYYLALVNPNNKKLEYEHNVAIWAQRAIDNIQSSIKNKEYDAKDRSIHLEYLYKCRDLVTREINIQMNKEFIKESYDAKLEFFKQVLELVEGEYCFESVNWHKIDINFCINLVADIISNSKLYTEIVSYLVDREEKEILDDIAHLGNAYDDIKEIVENNISKYYFFNDETEMYDIPKDINSINSILSKIGIASNLINCDRENIYIISKNKNFEPIKIHSNGKVQIGKEIYCFNNLYDFKICITREILKNDSIMEKECYSCNSKVIIDNIEEIQICPKCKNEILPNEYSEHIEIRGIGPVIDININDEKEEANIYMSLMTNCSKSKIDFKKYEISKENFIKCNIPYKLQCFDLNNITINLFVKEKLNSSYKFTKNQSDLIKKKVIKYILENNLGTVSYSENDIELNDINNTPKANKYNKIYNIKDEDKYFILCSEYKAESKNDLCIEKDKLIKFILERIDTKDLSKELNNRLNI